jgi:hypothetical protein
LRRRAAAVSRRRKRGRGTREATRGRTGYETVVPAFGLASTARTFSVHEFVLCIHGLEYKYSGVLVCT